MTLQKIGKTIVVILRAFCFWFTLFTIERVFDPASYQTPESLLVDLHGYQYYVKILAAAILSYFAMAWLEWRNRKTDTAASA